MCALAVLLLFLRGPLCAAFTRDAEIEADLAPFMLMLAVAQPFMGAHFTLGGVLRGAGDTVTPLIGAAVGNWGFRVPLAWVFARMFGAHLVWVWAALIADHLARLAINGAVFFRGRWAHRVGATVLTRRPPDILQGVRAVLRCGAALAPLMRSASSAPARTHRGRPPRLEKPAPATATPPEPPSELARLALRRAAPARPPRGASRTAAPPARASPTPTAPRARTAAACPPPASRASPSAPTTSAAPTPTARRAGRAFAAPRARDSTPNVCAPGNCVVDTDCGPSGFCSPSGLLVGRLRHRLLLPHPDGQLRRQRRMRLERGLQLRPAPARLGVRGHVHPPTVRPWRPERPR